MMGANSGPKYLGVFCVFWLTVIPSQQHEKRLPSVQSADLDNTRPVRALGAGGPSRLLAGLALA